MTGVRSRAIALLDSLGLGGPLRRARALVPIQNRSADDDSALRFLMACILGPESNFVDIGAHSGTFLVDALRIAPRGAHVAFEPLPDFAEDLRARFPTVDVRQVALSNERGASSFVHVRSRPSHSGLRRREYPGPQDLQEIDVTTERLDDSLPPEYVPSLVKIDVEGGELLVLDGARDILARHAPTIFFEHGKGGADWYGVGPKDIYALLCTDLGMRIFDIDARGPYSEDDLVAAFHANRRWNFIAHR